MVNSAEFNRLLEYLRTSRGFDFSSYKQTTLSRRIDKRMQTVGVEGYDAYQDYLEVHQDEFLDLFNTVLINVTSFFRDPEAWEFMRTQVIPTLVESKAAEEPIRVWVAGCATGEEACTIAILFAEALGPEAFRARVKIYATDLDDDALNAARTTSYSEKGLEPIPEALREKYFERTNGNFTFDRDLRRSLIYGRHNLILDAPISRVDLLLCRNTLMYFNAETQDRIIQRFHFALNPGAYLLLGRAETIIAHSELFATVDLKNRVFAKITRGRVRDRGFMFARDAGDTKTEIGLARLRDAALDGAPTAQIVIDNAGNLVLVNERARSLFGVGNHDLGLPIQDLEVSFRPVELRSGIEQAQSQRRPVRQKDVNWTAVNGESHTFEVAISVLRNDEGDPLGIQVVFEEVTALKRTQNELQSFRQELETAYEEVQSTNEELQTTNEELQSTIEELETTNEELQSTNEELETMNEETQSANEELETINEEVRLRSVELNRANAFMESILGSLREGVIVLDSELLVLAWNYKSEDLWGVRADEAIGKHLLNLNIGLPVDQFRGLIRTAIGSGNPQKTTVDAVTRRGRTVSCDVNFTPLRGAFDEPRGVIILTASASSAV